DAYGNLTLNGTGTKTAAGANSVAGNFTKGASATFAPGTSTFTFNGPSAQTITGPITFNNVTVNGAGVTVTGGDLTLGTSSVLTLTNGVLTTANNVVVQNGTTGAVTGANATSFVDGTLVLPVAAGSNVTRTFDVGSGSNYAPATVVFGTVTTGGTLSVKSPGTDHPSIATSDLSPVRDANRYWTLTPAGGLAFDTYAITVTPAAGDLDAAADPANFQ